MGSETERRTTPEVVENRFHYYFKSFYKWIFLAGIFNEARLATGFFQITRHSRTNSISTRVIFCTTISNINNIGVDLSIRSKRHLSKTAIFIDLTLLLSTRCLPNKSTHNRHNEISIQPQRQGDLQGKHGVRGSSPEAKHSAIGKHSTNVSTYRAVSPQESEADDQQPSVAL